MAETTASAVEAPAANPFARIGTVFSAPSKAFAAVKVNSGWWAPFLVSALVGVLYAWVVLHKIGLPTLVDGVIHQSGALESRMASATYEQAQAIRHQIEFQFKFLYVGPVFGLLFGVVCGGVLLATANFVAGGKATFKQMLGVWFYGTLPLSVFYLLVMVAIYAGVASDPFNIKNAIGTNPGFYLADSELPKMLMPLLSAIDIFAIWTAALLTIGVSTVAEIKRGAAAAVVVGWWVVVILLQVAGAAFGG